MIAGMTHRMLPHLSGVPHLHVNGPWTLIARESMRSKDAQRSTKEKPWMQLKNHDTLP